VPPAVDVVIPCHNNRSLTRACLASFERQTLPHRVIVVDDGSTDGTAAMVHEEFPQVEVVELDGNRGYTIACNRGVAAGSGEFVVLINNDTESAPDFLERILAPLEADPAVGSVTPVMVRPDGRIDNVGLSIDRTIAGYSRLQGRPIEFVEADEPPLSGPSGGAGAFRREAWEQAGGLDERISIYCDDIDLNIRLFGNGWRVAFAPDARTLHHGSQAMGKRSVWQRGTYGFSRGYFLRRYGILRTAAAPQALVTEALVCLADLLISRDTVALRTRLKGWRAARGLPRHELPPGLLAHSMGLRETLELRRTDYRLATRLGKDGDEREAQREVTPAGDQPGLGAKR